MLTHGFTLDEQGRKMSKSLGNITAPQTVCDQYGADILRLWVVGTDYTEDQRIGPEILKHQAEAYRRLRNTLRYLLGSLEGYSSDETVAHADMPELDRWVLHRLAELDGTLRRAVDDYDFHTIATELHNFCAVDLSAFYFDIRKDSIYCDAAGTLRRRAARTVMAEVFSFLTAWLAPITCFTAEEAWLARPGDMPDGKAESVHLRLYPDHPVGLARCRARREVEDGAGAAPRRHRCAGTGARREAHRLEPAGRAARPCLAGICEGDGRSRPGGDLHHLRRRSGCGRGAGRRLHPARRAGRGRGAEPRRGHQVCTLLAGSGGGRQVGRPSADLPALRRGGVGMRRIDRQAMALLVVTLVADQVSKQLLLGYLMKAGAIVTVIDGFFRLVIVWNRGVSFGLLGGDQALPPWVLSAVAIAVCIGLFLWLRRTDRP